MPSRNVKQETFRRLAQSRTNKILKALDTLANCANRQYYEYTQVEVDQVFDRIAAATVSVKSKFENSSRSEFRFRPQLENPAPDVGAIPLNEYEGRSMTAPVPEKTAAESSSKDYVSFVLNHQFLRGKSHRLTKVGSRSSYVLDNGKELYLRYSQQKHYGGYWQCFFGVDPRALESAARELYVVFVCGDPKHVFVVPRHIVLARLKEMTVASDRSYRIHIRQEGSHFVFTGYGERMDLTRYRDNFELLR